MKKEYDVLGIGNILVDYVAEVDEKVLKKFKLQKGTMHLKEIKYIQNLESKLKNIEKYPGGTVPNVIHGISNLGLKSAITGSIADDINGFLFSNSLNKIGIKDYLTHKKGNTGVAVSLVTPEGERTFVVNYGVTNNFKPKDLNKEYITKSKYVHLSGYEFENLNNAIKKATKLAKEHNTKISFDLGDPNLVLRNKRKLKYFIRNAYVLFANEDEATNLTGKKNPEKALDALSDYCLIPIVKIGKEGSLIKIGTRTHHIKGYKVEVENTIGAGDGFAAGFLYGLCKNYQLINCAKIGNLYASLVVQEKGATLSHTMYNIEDVIDLILSRIKPDLCE